MTITHTYEITNIPLYQQNQQKHINDVLIKQNSSSNT